ncbi:universal stress protein [Massilia sp. H6]|uniref:universal stress protein n=1 Tax=Massilia sp. H6 TaxID=2970464 RepID=UPI002166EAD0|nr:universal stress protein [Massilia sp. H6]UVW30223.1 universal stress protein [Massilia sp. H6]
MFKTIIVQVDDSPAMDARLQAAAWLAKAHDAHLVGSAATGLSWPAFVMLAGSMRLAPREDFDALRSAARASLQQFSERARRLGVQSIEERMVEEDHRFALLLQSRYADLAVLGQDSGEPAALRALPQYLALHGPRPVLVVPPTYAGASLSERIVVGWDGSAQAIRAIQAALPLLVQAGRVHLTLVNPDRESGLHGDEPGADMALYLARHGVRVEVVLERTQAATGVALLDIARTSGAGLLVAGAFGHSRYREILLGGVTRMLLERAAMPVLLAH